MKFLARLASWSSAHPVLAILTVLLITAGLGAGFSQAESGRVIEQFIPDDLEAVDVQEDIAERFGESEPAFVLFITDDPGAPDLLRAMDGVADALAADASVQSVASIVAEMGDVDGKSDAELRAAWEQATARPGVADRYIRDDATLMLVSFETGLEPEDIVAALDGAVEDVSLAGVEVMPAGLAYVEQAQSEGGAQDVQILLPLSVVAIVIILAILFRRPADVVIPIATTFVALAWAYGILVWAQMPLSPLVFSVMPLILGLGVDYMLHIVYAFRETDGDSHPRRFAIVGDRIGAPVFFTALTTLIGFGSFLVSKIPQVRSWGLLIGGGALSAFILGFLLLPALYRMSRPGRRRRVETHRFLAALGSFVVRRRAWVLVGLLLVTGGLGAAATQVDLERQLETEADPNDPASQALDEVESRFGGQSVVQFLVPRAEGAAALEQLEADVAETNGIGFVDGPATRVARSGAPADGYASDDPRLDGVSAGDAWLVTAGYDTDAERDILPRLEPLAKEANAGITGRGYVSLQAEGAVLDSLLLSTGVAFALVFALLFVVFRHPVPALLAFTPLVLVIIWQLGIQSLANIPLNSVTGITSAMVIGIGVDYSLHLTSDYQRSRKAGRSRWSSAVGSVTHVGQPVLAGTITTVVAFTILSFSQLSQLAQFGTVAAIVVACAFVVSLAFLPAVLGRQDQRVVDRDTKHAYVESVRPRFSDPDVDEWFRRG